MNDIVEQRMLRIAARARASSADGYHARYKSAAAPTAPEAVTNEIGGEQRRHPRHDLSGASVSIRRIGGFNFSVALRDVSAGGCRIELVERYDAEDHIIARFKRLEPLAARVCWTSGLVAGIEFQRAIHPAVLENMLGQLNAA
jgi:hypothetical protein